MLVYWVREFQIENLSLGTKLSLKKRERIKSEVEIRDGWID